MQVNTIPVLSMNDFIVANYTKSDAASLLIYNQRIEQTKLLPLSINLVLWSLYAAILEILIISSVGIDGITNGFSWGHVLPTLIFTIINLVLKYNYVNRYLGDSVPKLLIWKSVIPYLGSGFIFDYILHDNKSYKNVLRCYLKFYRKQISWASLLANVLSKLYDHKVKVSMTFISIAVLLYLKS